MKKYLTPIIIALVLLTSFASTSCTARLVAVKPAPRKKVIVVKKKPVARKVVIVKRH